jgi:hypothetical protein
VPARGPIRDLTFRTDRIVSQAAGVRTKMQR